MTTEQILAKHGKTSTSTVSNLENVGTLQSFLDSGAIIIKEKETGNVIRTGQYGRFITIAMNNTIVNIKIGNKIDVDAELLDVLELPLLSGISTIEGPGFGLPFLSIGRKAETDRTLDATAIAAMVAAAKAKALEAAKELAKA